MCNENHHGDFRYHGYFLSQIMKLLLEHGADPNLQDHLGRTPAHLVLLYWPRIQLVADMAELSPEDNQYQVDIIHLLLY